MTRPSVAIIGPGKVGIALAVLASSAGYRVSAVGARDPDKARAAAAEIGGDTQPATLAEAAQSAELVFLTVTDAAIAAVANELSLNPGSILAHCSGALTSEALASAGNRDEVAVASFHPLQTFPTVAVAVKNMPGSYCFLEGDVRALEALEAFGAAIGTHCTRIETRAKVLYHAGAVMACNYLSTLMDAALGANEAAGIEPAIAWPALRPLILSTLENIGRMGPAAALTGPVQRGDSKTVALHLRALQESAPQLSGIYRAMGDFTLQLAARGADSKRFSDLEMEELRRLLTEQGV